MKKTIEKAVKDQKKSPIKVNQQVLKFKKIELENPTKLRDYESIFETDSVVLECTSLSLNPKPATPASESPDLEGFFQPMRINKFVAQVRILSTVPDVVF